LRMVGSSSFSAHGFEARGVCRLRRFDSTMEKGSWDIKKWRLTLLEERGQERSNVAYRAHVLEIFRVHLDAILLRNFGQQLHRV